MFTGLSAYMPEHRILRIGKHVNPNRARDVFGNAFWETAEYGII